MTAHDRASRLVERLAAESPNAPWLRPSEVEAALEDAIREAVMEERAVCAEIAEKEEFTGAHRIGPAIRARPVP